MIINGKDYKNDKDTFIRIPSEKLDVQVLHYGFSKCSRHRPASIQDSNSEYSFHYIFSGSGYVQYDNLPPIKVNKGEIFVFMPYHKITYYTDKEAPYSYYWVTFNGEGVANLFNELEISAKNPILYLTDNKTIDKLFKNLFTQCQKHQQLAGIIAKSYLYNIIFNLLAISPNIRKIKSRPLPYIKLACAYIEENLADENLSLAKVAEYLHLNKVYLSRIFAQNLGIKFTDYLTELRVRKAITLMNQGETVVQNIAFEVGFKSPYYFSVVFKKIAKISPSVYISEIKASKNEKEKTKN